MLDNFSPHRTKKDARVGKWAAVNNVELAYTPTDSSWLNRIEAQFTALRYLALDGTDHARHAEQNTLAPAPYVRMACPDQIVILRRSHPSALTCRNGER
ncbi:hypothetical protein ACIBHX_20280 [Nonomuraea sp. NPDC050536]|uniref:hypothetical protein n=1 Tax=Nonomuraea sp. NPDC050536 TaxID=3364366 RepID=UPI0037C5C097